MEDIHALVLKAMSHTASMVQRHEAFGRLVKHFQDMAYGCAYAVLSDFQLAEDAAQEAFIAAYQDLHKLKDPKAFPGWFKQIVIHQCYRMTRRKHLPTEPLETALDVPSVEPSPLETVEAREMQTMVHDAIESLPEHERMATTLFYITGYSQKEIAEFLEVPVNTVKKRLQSARKRLKATLSPDLIGERMNTMVKDTLHQEAPSRDSKFVDKVLRMVQPESMKTATYRRGVEEVDGNDAWALMGACMAGDLPTVRGLIEKDPRLVNAQYWYQFPIHIAVREGHADIVKLMLDFGADAGQSPFMYNSWHKLLDIAQERGHSDVYTLLETAMKERFNYVPEFEELRQAIVARDREQVESVLKVQPELAHAADALGNNTIHWAVMTRQLDLIDRFLELGAHINAKRADGKTPVLLSLTGDYWFRSHRDLTDAAIRLPPVITGYLLGRGASYDFSVAVAIGDREHVEHFLKEDSGLACRLDSARHSPLFYAARSGYTEIVKVLLDHGADPNMHEELAPRGRALFEASAGNHLETARRLLEHGADPNAGVDSSGCCLTIVKHNHAENCHEMQQLLRSYGAFLPPYAMSPQELEEALRRNDQQVIEHEEFMRCVIGTDDVIRVMVETHPELVARMNDGVLWSNTHPKSRSTIQLLMEHGFDPNKPDWVGKTFLHACAEKGNVETVTAFLEFGADLNAIELEYGETPLAAAARSDQLEMVRFLLKRGADPNLADGNWGTPLARAEKEGHKEIADLLRKHGAT
ncbi:sigma-70 family RNA polymerase sigma factor [Candidatus Poribacteria bacterium]|nr:sigma-70 family RNA polymerase sigma factor [Candidatus Poribacteria bacterium]